MDNFGVVSKNLKVLAQEPPLPELISFFHDENEEITILGMKLKNVGVSERSAVAMFAEKGVFIVEIYENSKFYGTLQPADVILSYRGREINDMRDLQEVVIGSNWVNSITVSYYRRGKGTRQISITK